jgi:hypothetical protein
MTTPQTNPFPIPLLDYIGRNPGTILTKLSEYNVDLSFKTSGLRQKGYKYMSINLLGTRKSPQGVERIAKISPSLIVLRCGI